MFFIHTLSGDYSDLSLEAVLHKKEVRSIKKNNRPRKFIENYDESSNRENPKKSLSYAEKAYREALNIKNESEPIFHAYQIMSSPVKTIQPGIKIPDAWKIFTEEGVRHMPVVSAGKRIDGIISDRDLMKGLIISGDSVINRTDETVNDIMIREVITADMVSDIRRIAMVMFTMHIGTMPVMNEMKELEGIITRSDILHALVTYPPLKLWG